MIGIRVSITRYLGDEPQPGLVECEFFDAQGRRWPFVEKTAIVSSESLVAETRYPQPGVIGCEVVGRGRDASGRDVVRVATEYFPVGVDSDEKWMRFEVPPESLVEWEWGGNVERPWDGLP